MRLVFLGPPGAGKGTQARRTATSRKIPHISTGDMMRAAASSGSAIGQRAKGYLDAGKLVPDDVTIQIVRERLSEPDCERGFLLDGFPRTVAQAEVLDSILEELGVSLDRVVAFDVPDQVLKARLLERGRTEGRSDDAADVIDRRLAVYNEQTRPLVAFYGTAGKLGRVDGVGDVEAIARRIDALLAARS